MKKTISIILSIIIAFSVITMVSAADSVADKVEISFKVGESTLMINGEPVTVETPYVAGAGTTLVPLRVITEAFGALVTWVNETQEIVLEYPDVNITLQIGNTNAIVNNHTEVLSEAPVLSPNGVTMVPLRFVSETFGATVNYDNATSAITVVKVAASDEKTISGSTEQPRIGDSYWGWSMMTPSGMMMTERYQDGCYTYFEDEESAQLAIHIYDVSDFAETAYEDLYNGRKESFAAYTLSRNEKNEDASGNKNYRLTGRDKKMTIDSYSVHKGNYCYEVVFFCESGSEKIEILTAILESFKLEYAKDDEEKAITHDLSNVGADGYRLVKDDELKISFKIPATCLSYETAKLNLIWFASGSKSDPTEITVGVYSKNEEVTAKSLADSDRNQGAKYYNPKIATVSNVCPYTTYAPGENAYYYWITTDGLYKGDFKMYDVYFEKGDYIYNVTITESKGSNTVYETVMKTIEAEVLDSEKTGIFLKNSIAESEYTSSSNKWSVKLDRTWEEYTEPTATGAIYVHSSIGAAISLSVIDSADIKPSKFYDQAVSVMYDSMRREGLEVVDKPEKVSIGSKDYYTFSFYREDEEANEAVYSKVYMILMNGNIYTYNLVVNEEYANAEIDKEYEALIASFEIIK